MCRLGDNRQNTFLSIEEERRFLSIQCLWVSTNIMLQTILNFMNSLPKAIISSWIAPAIQLVFSVRFDGEEYESILAVPDMQTGNIYLFRKRYNSELKTPYSWLVFQLDTTLKGWKFPNTGEYYILSMLASLTELLQGNHLLINS